MASLAFAVGRGLAQFRSMLGAGPDFSVDALDNFLDYVAGEGTTWSGQAVTTTSAMRLTAVWRCIDFLSSSVAQLPIVTLRVNPDDGSKERAKNHYLYNLLHAQPNPFMTAFRFKRLMQTRLCTHGNALAYMDINGRGQTTALWPLPMPNKEDMLFPESGPIYRWRLKNGQVFEQPWYNVLHIRGMETDGFWGLSPIQVHRETISKALAVKEHGARFFSNGARPLGALKCTQVLTPEEMVLRREAWNAAHQGGAGAHKIAVLMGGMEYLDIGVNMVDAQYIESERFSILDICRMYGVPPHKAMELSQATFSNITEQRQEWLQDGLGQHLCNWEQELNHSLLSDREMRTIQIKFLANALMRMDPKARAEYFSRARQWGWMDVNEIRALEDMNPRTGGDILLQPFNMVQAGTPPKQVTQNSGPGTPVVATQ